MDNDKLAYNALGYAKEHILSDLRMIEKSCPEKIFFFVNTMLSLLKNKESKDLPFISLEIKRDIPFAHESIKAVIVAFPKLKEGQDEEMRKYLVGLLPEIDNEMTLEQFMCDHLKLNAKNPCDQNNYQDIASKQAVSIMSQINAGNSENFEIRPEKEIGTQELNEIVKAYYTKMDYELELKGISDFSAKRNDSSLIITVTNGGSVWDNIILVSVVPIPSSHR